MILKNKLRDCFKQKLTNMLRLINNNRLIGRAIGSQILRVSLLYMLTTAGYCKSRNSYENNANEATGASTEEMEMDAVDPKNGEQNPATRSTSGSPISPLNTHGTGVHSGKGELTIRNEGNSKTTEEARYMREEKEEEDRKNTENNKKPVLKLVNLDRYATINNPELNSGQWLDHCPRHAAAAKHRTYAEKLYAACGITSKGAYLGEKLDSKKNTVPVILTEIKEYERKSTPSIHETRSYLRRLHQLKRILEIKNADGTRRYVKDGDAHSITVADAATLEIEVSKSIAAKAGMHPLYENSEEKITIHNLKKNYAARLEYLYNALTQGNKEKGKSWNKDHVKRMIKMIECVRVEDETNLKPYVANAAESYASSRFVLKHLGTLGYDMDPTVDLMKLVTLAMVSIESNGEFSLEMF